MVVDRGCPRRVLPTIPTTRARRCSRPSGSRRRCRALNVPVPGIAVTPSTFRRALKVAGERFLSGPVQHLHPHLLRHAAATHNYERGMSLWEVQKLLGHDRPTTTVSYLATAHADPEKASLAAAGRAVQRLTMDKGNLR